ncbi:MAG: leucine-rich repeat protein [Lachnospiraceae bacterium]|nr:leucine-rich repeat protein [Lachnospiraceae bacterium]
MPDRWMKFWKKYSRKIVTAMGCTCAALFLVLVITNAQKLQTTFHPNAYADDDGSNEASINYDSTIFGANQNNDDGLEMDDEADEEYNLDNGEEDILDNENNSNQEALQVTDGSGSGNGNNAGNSSGNSNIVGISNDGTGPNIQGSGNIPGTDGGSGNGSGNGSGSDTPGGNTSGGDNPGGNTPGGNTPGGNTPGGDIPDEPDPDAGKYGTDYNTPENIQSTYPTDTEDQNKGLRVTALQVTKGSLMQHFYEGEAPRSAEMEEYITVRATMSDGTVRDNLKYKPSQETGGDYTVDWKGNTGDEKNSIGYTLVGGAESKGTYSAVISYRGASCEIPYDIVHWQITLKDFDESSQESVDIWGYQEFSEILSPEETPVINLFNSMQTMYNLIGMRTDSNLWEGTEYHYTNVMKEIETIWGSDEYCVEYFGGWTDAVDPSESESTGDSYKMKRPSDDQITEDGIYNVDMLPTWQKVDEDSEYQVALYGFVGYDWHTRLLGYTGDSSTLVVPQGVNQVGIAYLYNFAMDTNQELQNTTVTKIVLPSSVTYYNNLLTESFINFFPNLEEIEVAEDNQTFLSIDGILYDKTGKILLSVPAAKKSISKWSKTVEQISGDAFEYVEMEELTIPESIYRFNGYSFYNASIDTLTLSAANQITLGQCAFDSSLIDEDGNPVLGIKKVNIKANEIAWLGNTKPLNLYQTLIRNGADLQQQGLQITVPDSAENTVYLSYLKVFQEAIDVYTGTLGTAYGVLVTANQAQENYAYQDGYLLSKDKKTLIFASSLLSGDCKLPDDIQVIGKQALDNCSQIASLGIPSSVTTIEQEAFANAGSLAILYMRGENPPALGAKIFGETLKAGMKVYVSQGAYHQYLETEISVLDRDYGEGSAMNLFVPMDGLNNAIFHDGSIYYENGDGTYQLYKVKETIAGIFTPMEGTTSFLEGCFANCTMLDGVMMPDTVTTLEGNLFTGCQSLEVIVSNGTTAPQTDALAFADISTEQIKLFLPNIEDIENEYQSQNWTGFETIEKPELSYLTETGSGDNAVVYGVKESATELLYAVINSDETLNLRDDTVEICPGAFKGSAVASVGNASAVETIGAYAFEDCSNLVGIELSSSFWSSEITLGVGAFKNCSSLSSLTSSSSSTVTAIPYTIYNLPEECFYGCTSMVMVTCPSDMETVGKSCFAECSNMENIMFQQYVTTFGESSFENCSSLQYVISVNPEDYGTYYSMPYRLTSIPDNCFRGCVSLMETWLQSEVTSVGDYAFAGCESLAYMAFPAELKQLGVGSFQGCISMSEVYSDDPYDAEFDYYYYSLPYEITNIPESCFEDCVSLDMVSIEAAVTSIGEKAFYNCSSLNKLDENFPDIYELPEQLNSIGADSFGNCISLVNVIVDSELESLGVGAFSGSTSLSSIEFVKAPMNIIDLTDIQSIRDTYFMDCPLMSLKMGDTDLLVSPELLETQNLEADELQPEGEPEEPESNQENAEEQLPEAGGSIEAGESENSEDNRNLGEEENLGENRNSGEEENLGENRNSGETENPGGN